MSRTERGTHVPEWAALVGASVPDDAGEGDDRELPEPEC